MSFTIKLMQTELSQQYAEVIFQFFFNMFKVAKWSKWNIIISEVFTKHVYKNNVIQLIHNFTFEHYFGGNAHCKN